MGLMEEWDGWDTLSIEHRTSSICVEGAARAERRALPVLELEIIEHRHRTFGIARMGKGNGGSGRCGQGGRKNESHGSRGADSPSQLTVVVDLTFVGQPLPSRAFLKGWAFDRGLQRTARTPSETGEDACPTQRV